MQACVTWAKRAIANIVSYGSPPLHEQMMDMMGVVCEAVWTDVSHNQVIRCVRSFRTQIQAHRFWLDWLVDQGIMERLRNGQKMQPWMDVAFRQRHRDLAQALFNVNQWMMLTAARAVQQRCMSIASDTEDGVSPREAEAVETSEEQAARDTLEMQRDVQTIVSACNSGLLDSYFVQDTGLLSFLAPDAKPVVFTLTTRPRNALALAWFYPRTKGGDGVAGGARICTDFVMRHDKCREACDAHAAKCLFTFHAIPLLLSEGTTRFALA
jgi:hypothetical protein